jgi:hypothetical protein
VGLAVVFAVLRLQVVQTPLAVAIWPILGSLFMFRMIVYLYDLKHSKVRFDVTQTLAYFFLLPNVTFPLFPVVDFSTFKRTYYDGEQYVIYQRGLRWMLRGTLYLILYRIIYYYVAIAPTDVVNAGDLVRYLVANYLLMLRIFGQFDIIVGILHLFGFNLRAVNYLNLFASSFTDFWRRSNIYWKDFMFKVFYSPSYYRIKKWGLTTALVLATVFVFIVTWFLHAYQWFWILGSFPVTSQDMLFWGVFGVLMVTNLLFEDRFGRKRSLRGAKWNWSELGGRALKITGMFASICVLWSLWTSSSLAEWFSLISAVRVIPPFNFNTVAAVILGALAFLAIYAGAAIEWDTLDLGGAKSNFFRPAAVTGAMVLVLYIAVNPAVYPRLGTNVKGFVADLETNRLNQPDANLLTRGYYENLLAVNRTNSQLWEIYMQKPLDAEAAFDHALIPVPTNDFLGHENPKNASITYLGKPVHTNEWGMRDQDYSLQKPANTYRVALLGSSYVEGNGVGDDQTFENLVEARLNRDDVGKPYGHYEILNFAVSAYTTLQDLYVLENKAVQFQPDAVFFIANPRDGDLVLYHLAERVRSGVEPPYPFLREIVQKAGVTPDMSQVDAEKRLKPYTADIIGWSYRQMVQDSRARGIRPFWVYLPMPEQTLEKDTIGLANLARNAGFTTIDMTHVYDGQDTALLVVASYDGHPNAQGHKLIADRLYQALHSNEIWSALGLSTLTP